MSNGWNSSHFGSPVESMEILHQPREGGHYEVSFDCPKTKQVITIFLTHKKLRDFGKGFLQAVKNISKENAR